MALYIPHSILHLARLLYVRPETFGPYYVHLEFLCPEVLPVTHVLGTGTNTVNSIRAAPLQHRLFRQLSEDVEPPYSDVICTEVRWLSKGKILELF